MGASALRQPPQDCQSSLPLREGAIGRGRIFDSEIINTRDKAVHPPSIRSENVSQRAGSSQAILRHPEYTSYRCFLPDLTGFVAIRRVGPNSQRRLSQDRGPDIRPPGGVQPR